MQCPILQQSIQCTSAAHAASSTPTCTALSHTPVACLPPGQVHAGRPPWHLAVIAGAVVKAYEHISSQSVEYLGYLSKGQLPPASVSLTHFSDTLVIEGTKYAVRVARSGPTAFSVALGGSAVEVCTRKMADGGYLLQVRGKWGWCGGAWAERGQS